MRKVSNIYVRQNKASVMDSLLQIGQPKEFTFFEVSRSEQNLDDIDKDNEFIAVYFRSDK